MTALETAVELIRRSGAMRTPALAEKLGIGEAAVDAMLAPARADGRLITCDVELAGGRKVVEYRYSTSGGVYSAHPLRVYRPKAQPHAIATIEGDRLADPEPPCNHHSLSMDRLSGGAVREQAADGHAIHRNPRFAREEPQVHLIERAQAFFKKHGPMTARQVRELDTGIADSLKTLADQAVLGRLGGKTSGVIYGLPDQKVEVQPRETSPDKPPRSIHKRKGKRKQRTKVAKRRAARNALKAPVKPASRVFRPALAADGAILFLGAERGDFEIDRTNARIVVGLVRRLTAKELGATVQFVERLDAAEVGA